MHIGSVISSNNYFETYFIEPNRNGRNAVNLAKFKWPNGVVYYVFDNAYKAKDRSAVLNAMDLIVEKTCIQFLPKSPSQAEHIRFVKVIIDFSELRNVRIRAFYQGNRFFFVYVTF